MAIQHIETLDDPVQTTGSLQWAGQVSGTKPNRIQDDEAAELINVDLTPDGMLCPRPAIDILLQVGGVPFSGPASLLYVKLPGGEWMFIAQQGELWAITETGTYISGTFMSDWTMSILPIPSPSPKFISMTQLINVVYVANGSNKIAAVTIDPAGTPILTSQQISKFDDDETALPNISYVAEHRGRIFAVQKDSDIIWPSSILGVTATGGALVSFKLTDGIRVGKGEGDPIVALVPSRDNELLVFCKTSVWSVDANPLQTPDNWTITAITRQVGLVGPRAWTWVGNDVWFYSQIGITSVRRVIAGEDQEISPILSYQVQDVIDRVNTNAIDTIAATTAGRNVYFSLPTEINLEPNITLVYNSTTQHWTGTWNIPCYALTVSKFRDVQSLWAAGTPSVIYKFKDEVTDHYYSPRYSPEGEIIGVAEITAPVEATVRTKSYNWGDFKQLKSPESMEVECWEGAGEMDVMVQLDGQDESTLYPFLTVAEDVSLDVLPRFPLRFPIRFEWNNSVRRGWDLLMRPGMRECREMAVVLKLRGRWRLREIMVNAFINTYEIEI